MSPQAAPLHLPESLLLTKCFYPSQVVLARFRGSGRICWARILRLYHDHNGVHRCDVEWLRPPWGRKDEVGGYVIEDGDDDTDDREALLVEMDLHLPPKPMAEKSATPGKDDTLGRSLSFLSSTASPTSPASPLFDQEVSCASGATTPRCTNADQLGEEVPVEYKSFRLSPLGDETRHNGLGGCGEEACTAGIAWPELIVLDGAPLLRAPEITGALKEELAHELSYGIAGCGALVGRAAVLASEASEDSCVPVPSKPTESGARGGRVPGLVELAVSESFGSDVLLRDPLITRLYQLVEAGSGAALGRLMKALEAMLPSCTEQASLLAQDRAMEFEVSPVCASPELVATPEVGEVAGRFAA